jgi:hypothetical protein
MDEQSVRRFLSETNAIVADAKPQFAGVALQLPDIALTVSAKRWRVVRIRIAESRSIWRISARAGRVKMIFFTPVTVSA